MNDIDNVLANIIRSLLTNQSEIIGDRNITGMISTGDGYLYTNQHIEENIINASRLMYDQNPKFRETHSLKEWQSIFRSEIGLALPSEIDTTDCFDAEVKNLKQRLEEVLDKYYSQYGDLKTAYGCWLFLPTPTNPIEIGPVRFEDKISWLNRALERNEISKTTHSRLSRAFVGKRLKKRKPSLEEHQEEIIRNRISNAPMLCEVTMQGLATNLAYKRSRIAVNLALTSISLIWSTPSLILKRFRTTLDADPRISYDYLFSPEKQEIVSRQQERLFLNCYIEPEEWEAHSIYAEQFLKVAGEMIECWTSTRAYSNASPLLRDLSQSLFLFWKACQEDSEILSIIEYVAALETLAPGRNRWGILKLIEKRLGLDRSKEYTQGRTLEENMDKIYSEARNDTIHGSDPKLLYDWSVTRAITEELARNCLVACMIKAQDNWQDKEREFLLTNLVDS